LVVSQTETCLFPLKITGGVASKRDSNFFFVFLPLHFLIQTQKGREDWWDSIEVQTHTWGTPPGITFKPFFPTQALMATNGAFGPKRRQ